jgi:hypothetical protein
MELGTFRGSSILGFICKLKATRFYNSPRCYPDTQRTVTIGTLE